MRNYYESNHEGVLFLYFFGVPSVLFFPFFWTTSPWQHWNYHGWGNYNHRNIYYDFCIAGQERVKGEIDILIEWLHTHGHSTGSLSACDVNLA